MARAFSHGYALFVGVGRTSYPAWSLPVTVKDAQALVSLFTDPNYCAYPKTDQHIRFLHDEHACHQDIRDGLSWLQRSAKTDPEASIIVYYSGHGGLDRSTNLYYLIPHDVVPHDLPGSALSAAIFTDALRALPARRLLVMIDSCHAEGMATAKGAHPGKLPPGFAKVAPVDDMLEALKQGEGRAIFTSCRGKQLSYICPDQTRSIYTHHLLEALKGAGNQKGDTQICFSHIMSYVGKTVPVSAKNFYHREQTPFFDLATEDFPIALLRGGKGLPAGGWNGEKPANRQAVRQERRPGERSVTINGNAQGAIVVTGDNNSIQSSGSETSE
jgi:hypothetical protein